MLFARSSGCPRREGEPATLILSPGLSCTVSMPRIRSTLTDAVSASQSTALPLASTTVKTMCPCGFCQDTDFTVPATSTVSFGSKSPAWLWCAYAAAQAIIEAISEIQRDMAAPPETFRDYRSPYADL